MTRITPPPGVIELVSKRMLEVAKERGADALELEWFSTLTREERDFYRNAKDRVWKPEAIKADAARKAAQQEGT